MMGPFEAVGSVFAKYATFRGRAPRSEFWWFFLFELVAMTVCITIDVFMVMANPQQFANPLEINPFDFMIMYYALLTFVPRLAVTIRRLHDVGFSGFMILVTFVPFVGWLVLQVLLCLPSEADDNNHGPPWRRLGGKRIRSDGVATHDPMQGYAHLVQNDVPASPELRAAREEMRKAEVRRLYEERVLGMKPQT